MSPKHKQLLARAILSAVFIGIGITHFTATDRFVENMPPYLPLPRESVLVSGVFEIAGGIGLWAPWQKLRRFTAYCIIALLVSVYVVNIDMAIYGSPMRSGTVVPGGSLLLWLRLPFQFVMMWMALYATRPDPETK
jgi:uncharacterized membrane protein